MRGDKNMKGESIEKIREIIEGSKQKPIKKETEKEEIVPEGMVVIDEKDSKLTDEQMIALGLDPAEERLKELILDEEIKRRKEKKSGG